MRQLRLLALVALGSACGDGTSPPAPARIELSRPAVTLDAIGARQVVSAVVRDEAGQRLEGSKVSWSSTAAVAVTPSDTNANIATLTAIAAGEATVTISVGGLRRTLPVAVQQVAVRIVRTIGDNQFGTAGAALPTPIEVRVEDRLGEPAAGAYVMFTVAGGGVVSVPAVTTGADGVARTMWTLGTQVSLAQAVIASVGAITTSFRATGGAGPAAAIERAAGEGQPAWTGAPVETRPAVRVTDAFGNPIAGAAVVFSTSTGSVTGASQSTNASGMATVGSWTLGTEPGPMTLTATATTIGASVTFALDARTGLPLAELSVVAGNGQIGTEGQPAPTSPAILITDTLGVPQPGRTVTFTVTRGGGSIAQPSVVTDAEGRAHAAWRLGSAGGENALEVQLEGGPAIGNHQVVKALGCTGGAGAYTINVCFTTPVTASQRAAFVNAAVRWSSIIIADVPDIDVDIAEPVCGSMPSISSRIDDLVIFAGIETIDGPGSVLGSAGWCYRRDAGLPLLGGMRFDIADVEGLEATDRFDDVILHEMGHVIGIGTIWFSSGFLQAPSAVAGPPLDTHFDGPQAIIGFDQIGGSAYTGGAKVPVENAAGQGSINSHWRESALGNELMTPFLNSGSNPLTALTVLSLIDIGYSVNPAAADANSMSDVRADRRVAPSVFLGNDVYAGPRHTIDRRGRVRRIQ